jgi:protein gp37
MNRAERDEKHGAPVAVSVDSDSITTRAPDPLSKMPATVLVVETAPSVGMTPCMAMDCSPWTSMAGSKSPSDPRPAPPRPTMVAKVGSTCCCTSAEFSVVNWSS